LRSVLFKNKGDEKESIFDLKSQVFEDSSLLEPIFSLVEKLIVNKERLTENSEAIVIIEFTKDLLDWILYNEPSEGSLLKSAWIAKFTRRMISSTHLSPKSMLEEWIDLHSFQEEQEFNAKGYDPYLLSGNHIPKLIASFAKMYAKISSQANEKVKKIQRKKSQKKMYVLIFNL
jgi:hypothetical protein